LLHFVGIAHRGEEKAKNLPYGDQRRPRDRPRAGDRAKCVPRRAGRRVQPEREGRIDGVDPQDRDDGYTVLLIEHDMRVVMGVTTASRAGVRSEDRRRLPAEIREDPKVIAAYLGCPMTNSNDTVQRRLFAAVACTTTSRRSARCSFEFVIGHPR